MRVTEGDAAWLTLAAFVILYEVWAIVFDKETLSTSYARALEHPVRGPITVGAWLWIVGHLLNGKRRHAK